MALFSGPLAYLTDGAPSSLSAFPEVASFAQAIGSTVIVARIGRSPNGDDQPDSRFVAALAAHGGETLVVTVPRKRIGAELATLQELRGGALALLPHRRRGLARLLIGTTYERLMRETRLPLLALPNDGKIGTVRRVLFPADLAPRSLPVFDQTVALCRDLDADLVVLHAYGTDQLLPSEVDMERRMAAQNPLELFNVHKQQIAELVERATIAGVRATAATAEGRAHVQILAHTAANPIDLVVMATHGIRSAEDVLQGSTTVRVVQRAPVPVLVMRA